MELKRVTSKKFRVTVTWQDHNHEMIPWLEAGLGPGGRRGCAWRINWTVPANSFEIWFTTEAAATYFMLRWAK